MQAITFQGPLLNSNNGHEWLPEATLFLRQNRVYRIFTTEPPEHWESKPSMVEAQDAAIGMVQVREDVCFISLQDQSHYFIFIYIKIYFFLFCYK
jgi:hypothetical protein